VPTTCSTTVGCYGPMVRGAATTAFVIWMTVACDHHAEVAPQTVRIGAEEVGAGHTEPAPRPVATREPPTIDETGVRRDEAEGGVASEGPPAGSAIAGEPRHAAPSPTEPHDAGRTRRARTPWSGGHIRESCPPGEPLCSIL
jgi:hypothetical protein